MSTLNDVDGKDVEGSCGEPL